MVFSASSRAPEKPETPQNCNLEAITIVDIATNF
jgi:hypothetical protein